MRVRMRPGNLTAEVGTQEAQAAHAKPAETRALTRALGRIDAVKDMTVRADSRAEAFMGGIRGERRTRAVKALSHLGDGGAIWILLIGACNRRDIRRGIVPLLALLIGALLVNGPLKSITGRRRPAPLEGQTYHPGGGSFPSGHAFSSWMAAMLLPAGALRRLGMVMATLLSLSRNYMRYHHASDVVAGATLGAIVGGLLRRALK